MKISTRLLLGFGCVVLLGVTVASLGSWQLHRLSNALDDIATDKMVKVDRYGKLRNNFSDGAEAVRNLLIAKDDRNAASDRQRILDLRADNQRLLEALDQTIHMETARTLLQTINAVRPAYNRLVDEALQLDDRGDVDNAAKLLLGPIRAKQETIFEAVDESIKFQSGLAERLASEAESNARQQGLVMAALALAMACVGGLVTWLLCRNLSSALGAEPVDLGAAAERVAGGDLSIISGANAAPLGSVLASLGKMQAGLAGVVGEVRASSDTIATGSAQIATGNADLSQRTEEQASNLQQTAASMEQISSTVKANTDTARQANEMAVGAAAAAERGGQLVGDVVRVMQDLSGASQRIADITGVIDSIAFQTNILALNAAVEAARAGDQGRGFAVVASEVRTLAQRSADAAKEIKLLINTNVEKTLAGTHVVDAAGQSMRDIVAQVGRVSQMISEMSHATAEQSVGIAQVGDAVSQLDQVTQQNAALVEESAAAADSLRAQAARLAEVVSVFRLTSPV